MLYKRGKIKPWENYVNDFKSYLRCIRVVTGLCSSLYPTITPNHHSLLLFAFCGLAALFCSMFRREGELGRILEAWCSAVLTRKAVISNFWKLFLDVLSFGRKSDFREGQSNYLNQFRSERIKKSWERFAEVIWIGGLKYFWQMHVVKYEILVYFLCVLN